jgi:O-antigen/teichoic acid export membrane protein
MRLIKKIVDLLKIRLSALENDGFLSAKLSSDLIWNTASIAIMGVVGLLLNIVIARYYGASILGVFNQVYVIYILLSQLAVSGIHLSILKVTAQYGKEPAVVRESFSAAFLLTIITAGIVTSLAFWGKDLISKALSSPRVAVGLFWVLPGLFLFSLNKALLALLNGLRRMKAYATFQALRYIMMLSSLIALVFLKVDGSYIPILFSMAEGILFLLQLPYSAPWFRPNLSKKALKWMKAHWVFGIKAMVGNLLLDINSRVDILLLGLFASDSVVGVYSFAAMLADGFTQLPEVFRTVINPVLTQTFYENGKLALEATVQRGKKWSYLVLIPVGLATILCYPFLIRLGFGSEFNRSWPIFTILMAGVLISAGYLPFQLVFNQVGQPGTQTLLLVLFFITNVTLNLLLIPLFGMYGSAIATALAFVLQVPYINRLGFYRIGIRI